MDFSNLTNTEIALGVAFLLAIIYKYFITHKDDDGRIKDKSVKVSNVLETLSTFEMKYQSNLKDGYTEKSIQNQLKKHLLEEYVNVVDEYGIEGINATKIDFDIGNGEVGLELKLAKSIFRTSNLHRLSGQIDDYMQNKYDNLIVVVFGEKSHSSERAMLTKIQEKVEEKEAIYYYFELPKRKIKNKRIRRIKKQMVTISISNNG
ncbi:MAG: hypothetical protein L3J20_02110 [Flavobacteriaceae bacterium]|nr:hypothetical protein [Flavobacteriaceae bacterium]